MQNYEEENEKKLIKIEFNEKLETFKKETVKQEGK